MIGIVIVSHGKFAEGLKDALTMITGYQPYLATVSLEPGDNMDEFKQRIGNAITETDNGDGCIVFADLFGASPANSAAYWTSDKVQVITGANLPMALELLALRETSCNNKLALSLIESGNHSLVSLNAFLAEKLGK
jgi:mannose/fructose/sorbose-specific phosphotransferase system IIA component